MITQDLGKAGITANSTWDISQAYERNSIVFNMLDNTSYLSRRDVPAGADINDVYYWQPFAGLSIDDGSVSVDKLASDVKDLIYASFPVDTASGDIASFEDGADNVPVRELKLNLEPYQNLNGYDSPWVGGAGVNKFNSKGLNTYTNNGITITESNGTLALNGTATANAYFAMGGLILPQGSYRFAIHNASANSNVHFSFQDSSSAYFGDNALDVASKIIAISNRSISTVVLYVANGTTLSNFTVKPQLESGTTATAWTPYENICPIYPANGKNLIPSMSQTKTVNGITWTLNSDGTITATGTTTATSAINWNIEGYMELGGAYILSGSPSGGSSTTHEIMIISAIGGGALARDFGAGVTINPWLDTYKYIQLAVRHPQSNVNLTFKPMIRPAEITDPTYVPYNAIGITRTGKNLYIGSPSFDGFKNISTYTIAGETYNGHEVIYKASAWGGASKPIQVKEGYTYTFSAMVKVSVANKPVFMYGSSGLIASKTIATANTWTRISGTYSATKDGTEEFRIESESNSYTVYLSEYQLEVGSSATQYEPYTGERYYPISDNPIYGGTLEVETGVLTVTKGYIVSDGTDAWAIAPNDPNAYFYRTMQSAGMPSTNYPYIQTNEFKTISQPTERANAGTVWGIYGQLHVNVPSTIAPSGLTQQGITEFKTWLSSHNMHVVYELATPIVYQLTPVQVKTLLGYNNIWTDSGTVEVQYLANIGLYIQKIIGATEDDMVANQNIAANQYFFVGEELYYSTSAISAGQTIVVGTNCIKTNLADALNALNS